MTDLTRSDVQDFLAGKETAHIQHLPDLGEGLSELVCEGEIPGRESGGIRGHDQKIPVRGCRPGAGHADRRPVPPPPQLHPQS